jgi:cell division protein ZapA
MQEVREAGKTSGLESVAIIAGLNVAHQLLMAEHEKNHYLKKTTDRLLELQNKIEHVLTDKPTSEKSEKNAPELVLF